MKYQGDPKSAKDIYMQQLNSDDWVTFMLKQLSDGTWSNPAWELFHHWVKLGALGASDSEISALITSFKQKGFTTESDVDSEHWRSYFVCYSSDSLNHHDVDAEARNEELVPGYSMSEVVINALLMSVYPKYHTNDSIESSGLSGNTQVLMSSGKLKPIKNIKAGDVVKTPSGNRKVLLLSAPKRGERYIYRINKLPFCFTEMHPFLSFSKAQTFVAVSSVKLLNKVPLLGQHGGHRVSTSGHGLTCS